MRIKLIESRVKQILEDEPNTRGDDYVLYGRYISKYHNSLVSINLVDALTNHIELGMPSFETVTRVRRRLQADTLSLRPTESTRLKRKSQEENFIDYARRHAR